MKCKVISVTSSKGGVGKSVFLCNLAGCFSYLKKHCLIIDNDLFTGSISTMLNLDNDKTIFDLCSDINNSRFSEFKDYISEYDEFIDVLSSPVDPRCGNKIDVKFIERVITMCKYHYDVILIDGNHLPIASNLIAMDNSDVVLYMINNDVVSMKNSKSAMCIYNDIMPDKIKVVLNNSRCSRDKKYFSNFAIKNVINHDVDFVIGNGFYVKDIDKFIMEGKILILNKKLCLSSKDKNMLIRMCNSLLEG